MFKKFAVWFLAGFIAFFVFRGWQMTGAPPYGESAMDLPDFSRFSWLNNWQRPEGPAKVALQVGHWKNNELPKELEKLKGNTGASGGGQDEWEVNLRIAQAIAKILKEKGVMVDILPATIPPAYWADVFVAIHTDGSPDYSKSGFKIASPWRDFTNRADDLKAYLEDSYGETTGLDQDPNISRNMRGYYAFSWWRYEHAIHPMTTAVIIETGFLTNPSDRRMLVDTPEIPAQAIAEGALLFLNEKSLL